MPKNPQSSEAGAGPWQKPLSSESGAGPWPNPLISEAGAGPGETNRVAKRVPDQVKNQQSSEAGATPMTNLSV